MTTSNDTLTKTVFRRFKAFQVRQLEAWLSDMAKQGWVLTYAGLFWYEFELTLPDEYQVRALLLEQPHWSKKSKDMIQFVEDTGAEYIDGNWKHVIFKKPTAEGPFELLSDRTSRYRHLKQARLKGYLTLAGIIFIFLLSVFLFFDYQSNLLKSRQLLGILIWPVWGVYAFNGIRYLNSELNALEDEMKLLE